MTTIQTTTLIAYLAIVSILLFSMVAKWAYDRKQLKG